MRLTLSVESEQRAKMAEPSFTFGQAGGTIGRDIGCTWALPDERHVISGRHAEVAWHDGQFVVMDASRNGVFVNGGRLPLGRGNAHPVANGDRFRLGDITLVAALDAAAARPPRSLDMSLGFDGTLAGVQPPRAGDSDMLAGFGAAPQAAPRPAARPLTARRPGADDDALDGLFDVVPDNERPGLLLEPDRAVSPDPLHDLPRVEPAQRQAASTAEPPQAATPRPAAVIPDDWSPAIEATPRPVQPAAMPPAPASRPADPLAGLGFDLGPPPATPGPAEAASEDPFGMLRQREEERHHGAPSAQALPPERANAAAAPVEALWRALGVDPARLSADDQARFLGELGMAVREMSDGLIQVLGMRQGIKSEFRIEQTMIGATENNLFKFTRNADELLALALTNRNRVFLPMDAAARGAFADIKAHEMATIAAVQLSIRSLLDRFDPRKVERQVRERKGGLFGFLRSKKSRCWDFFSGIHVELAADADEASSRLFAVELGRAYRERVSRGTEK